MSQFRKTPDPPAEVPIKTTFGEKSSKSNAKCSQVPIDNLFRLLNPVVGNEVVNDGLDDVLAIEHSAVSLEAGVPGAGVEVGAAVRDIN